MEWLPSCKAGVSERLTPVRGQIDTWVGNPVHRDQPSGGFSDQEYWTWVGRVTTGIQAPICADIWTPGHRPWTEPSHRRPASEACFTETDLDVNCSCKRWRRFGLQHWEQLVSRLLWRTDRQTSTVDKLASNKHMNVSSVGGSVAEWLRRWTRNSEVASSIPGRGAVE